jgi:hypothetical protein
MQESLRAQRHCKGWEEFSSFTAGVECPATIVYPEPPDPVETLFIGWNPPGGTHFWNSNQDKLRKSIAAVLWDIGWDRQANFMKQFLDQHCYLIHAVPCWKKAKFPVGELKTRLTTICARNLLAPTLATIQPKRICALGNVPHIALHAVLPGIPETRIGFRYSEGLHRNVGPYEIIITCFPNTWPVDRQNPSGSKNRDCTVKALRRWWGSV